MAIGNRTSDQISLVEHAEAAKAKRVKIVDFEGGDININPDNLNLEVQLEHDGSFPDSTRIGDGTEEWQINPSGEGTVHDASLLAAADRQTILSLLTNARFLNLGNYDRVAPEVSGSVHSLKYFEKSANIARADLDYTDFDNWELSLFAYINEEDGDLLLAEDGTELLLD